MDEKKVRRQVEQFKRGRRSVGPSKANRALKAAGFVLEKGRGKGDHRIYRHPSGRKVSIDPRNPLLPVYVKQIVVAIEEVLGDEDDEQD
jgi:predicted RNA binding protein YcfA (HicA-like mRNA interferase family)